MAKRILTLSLLILILLSGCETRTADEEASPASASGAENDTGAFSGDEMAPEEGDDKLYAAFSNGPNGDFQGALSVGDSFLGFTLEHLEVEMDNEEIWSIQADFTGSAILKGRLYHEDIEGPNMIRFEPAEESQSLLPYPVGIERTIWFGFTDEAAVKNMVGQDYFDLECEIVIDAYNIHFAYAGVWDTASLVSLQL